MRSPAWTEDQNATLRKLVAEGLTSPQIAARMGRSPDAISARRHLFGISAKTGTPNGWSASADVRLLRLYAEGKTSYQIADALDVSRCAAIGRLERLIKAGKLTRREQVKRPPPRELPRIRELAGLGLKNREIAERIGKTEKFVKGCAARYKIRADLPGWTAESVQLLTDRLAAGCATTDIANELGLTRNQVIGKALRMGLKLNGQPPVRGEPRVKAPRPPKAARVGVNGRVYQIAAPVELPPLGSAFSPLPDTQPRPWESRAFGECCWPIDTPEGVHSCCATAFEHDKNRSGYCRTHFVLSRAPSQPKKISDKLNPDRWRRAA